MIFWILTAVFPPVSVKFNILTPMNSDPLGNGWWPVKNNRTTLIGTCTLITFHLIGVTV